MPPLLDQLAVAFHTARGSPHPRQVVKSVELFRQFGLPITPTRWQELARQLAHPLPPLERRPGRLWSFPRGWTTVGDLALFLAEERPDLGSPGPCTLADWVDAQVFVGVRACLWEVTCGVPAEEAIVRSARLMADLGLE